MESGFFIMKYFYRSQIDFKFEHISYSYKLYYVNIFSYF